jgi:hypothetical protein
MEQLTQALMLGKKLLGAPGGKLLMKILKSEIVFCGGIQKSFMGTLEVYNQGKAGMDHSQSKRLNKTMKL